MLLWYGLVLFVATSPAIAQIDIKPINNTLGIFFHEESDLKISNEKWTLLVYKDLDLIKKTIDDNNRILEHLSYLVDEPTPRMTAFKSEIKTHTSLLYQISRSLETKYYEIFDDTTSAMRMKRGLINAVGTIWKAITGNLDSSDGEYFNDCINKVSRDERELQNLMKNQISVTLSVIKKFNNTVQKLRIDEETFNQDLKIIGEKIYNIADNVAFVEARLEILEFCEQLMESYLFLQDSFNDILNSISFARLKVIHPSVITPKDLVDSLQDISHSLSRNNLPLPINLATVSEYLNLMELEAYQTKSKVVFALRIPLLEPEVYTLYRVLPLPIPDQRTGLFHVISTIQRYIAKDDDSLLYVSLQNFDNCKSYRIQSKICYNLLPYPIDNNAVCEAQLLRDPMKVPSECQIAVVALQDYRIQELAANLWLITISSPIPISVKCGRRETVTKTIKQNSVLKMSPTCSGFVGTTRIHARYTLNVYKNVTYRDHPVEIPFRCCEHLPDKQDLPELKPLKLNKINTEELDIANHKLNQYSEELDKMMNEPFITKHLSWFTYIFIASLCIAVIAFIYCKCKKKRPLRLCAPSYPSDGPSPDLDKTRFRPNLFRRRRPTVQPREEDESIELQ
ncbi:unnamed protein product [Callosobruchus maculatus]|uniref:Envelope fusion protein n=1 Tax=Callosobruchus maculatus TaxID=64391 RepID=A0A653BKP6_CALMS|nr:unnamed protein product [Callosobruchus maculatus]